jgi:hypothetical protein
MTLLSPGVETKETNLQTTIARSSTGRAALVGKFNWGAAFQVSQVVSESDLVDRFGKPDDLTADSFFSAANFLQYGNDLRLVRILDETAARNSSPVFDTLKYTINSAGIDYKVGDVVNVLQAGQVVVAGKVSKVTSAGGIQWLSVPTELIIKRAKAINDYPNLTNGWQIQFVSGGVGSGQSATATINGLNQDAAIYFPNDEVASGKLSERSELKDTFVDLCEQYGVPVMAARYPGSFGDNLRVAIIAYKDYYKFDQNGQIISVATVDLKTYPTGAAYGAITPTSYLEYGPQNENQFAFLVFSDTGLLEARVLSTKAQDRDIYGSSVYVDEFFSNGGSAYIQAIVESWPVNFTGVLSLGGGKTGNATTGAGAWIQGWDMFADREHSEVDLLIGGSVCGEGAAIASTVQKAVVAVADARMDCLATISPPREYIVNKPVAEAVRKIVNWRNGRATNGDVLDDNMNVGSTYAVIDGNYKYQYDKYNDVNRWVALSADIAGLCARTDTTAQPWNSPAGFNRGSISNVIKLAIETRQAHRDEMYQAAINPVVGFAGQGYVLYGDKTSSKAPTPFDRINVRRLFNLLKKSISESAKYRLFELNDSFTRSSFRSEVAAYLDTIRSMGGIYDFRVVCDDTNNTPSVIDRNEFVASIIIKPARSINFIQLNFIATSTGADFDELVGGVAA